MSAPTVWVDADACPRPVRDVVCRAAERRQVRTVFVAASPINVPRGRFISSRTVAAGFDAADENRILMEGEGAYTFTIEAESAAASQFSSVYRGVLQLRQ